MPTSTAEKHTHLYHIAEYDRSTPQGPCFSKLAAVKNSHLYHIAELNRRQTPRPLSASGGCSPTGARNSLTLVGGFLSVSGGSFKTEMKNWITFSGDQEAKQSWRGEVRLGRKCKFKQQKWNQQIKENVWTMNRLCMEHFYFVTVQWSCNYIYSRYDSILLAKFKDINLLSWDFIT